MLGTFSLEPVVADVQACHRPVILDLVGDQHSASCSQSFAAEVELGLVAAESTKRLEVVLAFHDLDKRICLLGANIVAEDIHDR